MIELLLRIAVKLLLCLRYRITVRGLEQIARAERGGILFLPNHPALIDPIILLACLNARFRPRVLADQDQIDRFFVRWLAKRARARPIPDITKYGPSARGERERAVVEALDGLRRGDNWLLYPSGHLYRSHLEDLRGNSAVEMILREAPGIRVVLVRTRGVWGSGFSLASGEIPNVARVLREGLTALLFNLLLFSPRRRVTIELFEPVELPRNAARADLNAFLEKFYNTDAPPNTYVPYGLWESEGVRIMPDPVFAGAGGGAVDVPESTRQLVIGFLRKQTGVERFRDSDRLAHELGMDSLARAELLLWLNAEFGEAAVDVDSLRTVGDVLLAARGEAVGTRMAEMRAPPSAWSKGRSDARASLPAGRSIAAAFLAQARRGPGRMVVADQPSGAKSYRDLITAILVLKPLIERLPGQRVGIMLPASVAACVAYLACLFARKTPVMVNWTTGTRNIVHSLDLTGAAFVLTAGPLVARIESQGTDLSEVRDRFLYLETIARDVSSAKKFVAWSRARFDWSPLKHDDDPETAVILLTSGSETLPKAVPLTHTNVLANLGDVLRVIHVRESDCLIGFLPPFHSFGLVVTMLAPLLAGMRAVYHANPTETWMLSRLIDLYKATILVGTPTFLNGIVRTARPAQLASLRLAITGAEKCPDRVYETLARACPRATILEGYGVTECSPIVSVNREEDPRPGTIGRLLPSLECAIVDPELSRRVSMGEVGMLLVRGPSVFGGYLGAEVASPFVDFEKKSWYRTGDLVSEDAHGVLTFRGRLKRFVKLGGEMISLPAIEAVLERQYVTDRDEGPVLAVDAAASDDRAEIILYTARDIDRQTANRHIRDAGLSALHNVSRVVRLDQIPVLGTGKTDYRALRATNAE